jgi:hypothetical protein
LLEAVVVRFVVESKRIVSVELRVPYDSFLRPDKNPY